MKNKNTIFTLLLFGIFSIESYGMTLDEQIAQMKNAPAKQRVKMMNQLKRNLLKMNSSQRAKIISKLRQQVNHTKFPSSNLSNHIDTLHNIHPQQTMIQQVQSLDTTKIIQNTHTIIQDNFPLKK